MTTGQGPTGRDAFCRFIGVDLGGGRGKNTAVARLQLSVSAAGRVRLGVAEAKVRHGQRGTGRTEDEPGGDALFRDDVLVEYLRRWVDDTTVVAFNAPLTMPPCVRCQLPCPGAAACTVPVVQWMRRWAPRLRTRGRSDKAKPATTPYTQRATEVLSRAVGVEPRETLGQGSGPLAARAHYLRRALSPMLRLHENLIEVHPRATVRRRFGEAVDQKLRQGETDRVWGTRKRILAGLTEGIAFDYVWPELVVRNAHVFNAVLCAFTAYVWARTPGSAPATIASAGQPEADLIGQAVSELGELWLEDGWIYLPPAPAA
jgi:phage shock protein PspC (stress-responsive transcriptional regulator)